MHPTRVLCRPAVAFALLAAVSANLCLAEPKMDAKVKLPQRLMLATELLREINAQTGLQYAFPSDALVRQIDVTPFAGEATVAQLTEKLAAKVAPAGDVLLLEADLPDAKLKVLTGQLASDKVDDRRAAAYELGGTKSTKAIAPLMAALADKDESVRYHVLWSLDRLERDIMRYDPPGRASIFTLVKDASADKFVEILKSAPDRITNEWVWAAGLVGRCGMPDSLRNEMMLGEKNGYAGTAAAARWTMFRAAHAALDAKAPPRPSGDSTGAEQLVKDFADAKEPEAQADLLLKLGRKGGKAAWDLMLDRLDSKDPVIRRAAITGLNRCPDSLAVRALVNILTGPDESERQPAAPTTAAEKGTPSSAMTLAAEYRNMAALSLGMIGSPEVVAKLSDYIAKAKKPISSAALALTWTGDPAAEPALIASIRKPDEDKNSTTNDVLRSYAYIGLARFGSAAGADAIMTRYDEYDNTARYMGYSSVRLARGQSAVDRFVQLVKEGKSSIAPHGLEMAEDPRAVDALIGAVASAKGERMNFALQALGRIGDPKAIPALVALLDHPQPWVAYDAMRALRWRWYWPRADVQAALKKHPIFKAFIEPQPPLADQPENTWVCRNWQVDFDDYRVVNTTYEAGMTFDESTGKAVKVNAHGQRCDASQLGETWLYDAASNTWKQSNSPVQPFGMCGTWTLAYDRANRKVVFLEGEGGHHGWQWERGRALRGNVPWVYDGSADSWTPMNPLHMLSGPGLRAFGPMAYLDKEQKVFLFGSAWGGNTAKELADRAWTYDTYANAWAMLPAPKEGEATPGTRDHHAMCYLPELDRVLLAPGGKDPKTWLFDPASNTWADAGAKGNPPKFSLPMVYDPVSKTALVFIAEANGTHIWQYDPKANAWAKVDSPVELSPHHDSVDCCYDPKNGVFIMDGGHLNWNTDHIAVREVWTYKFKKAAAGAQAAVQYFCPMHPEVVSTRPGQCPKCGMALVERPVAANIPPAPPAEAKATPPIPAGVVVSVLSDRAVQVRWAKADPASRYNVYAATVATGSRMHHKDVFKSVGKFELLTREPIKGTEFVDARKLADAAGLFDHEIRAYYVTTVRPPGAESGPSATVLTLTSSVPRVTAAEQPNSSTIVKWEPSPEQDIRGYAVYRMDEFRTTLAFRLNPAPVKQTIYVDWDESPRSERRRYYVVAVDALNQEGVPSSGAWAFGRP